MMPQVAPLPGAPRIGFATQGWPGRLARKQGLVAGPGSAYESFLVGMPDGTWGYWIADGSGQPGFSGGSGCCQ